MDLEAVRPAVVLRCEIPIALRADAENPAERDVHAPEVALAVEGRTLEEAVDQGALAVGIRPGGAAPFPELRRQGCEALHLELFYLLKRVQHGMRCRISVLTPAYKETLPMKRLLLLVLMFATTAA